MNTRAADLPRTSIALVEDDAGMRGRLVRVLSAEPTLELVHAASTATQITDWLHANAVNVLLVDLGLPDGNGLDVIRVCRRVQPACAVMVLTMFADEAHMVRAFEAGASGYLLKDGTEPDLAAHIHSLHAGGSPMSPVIARQLLLRWRSQAGAAVPGPASPAEPPRGAALEQLSKREADVLDLVSRGFTYGEIARQLGIALSTVQTHVRNVYAKLDVHNRAEAVYEARLLGLLP